MGSTVKHWCHLCWHITPSPSSASDCLYTSALQWLWKAADLVILHVPTSCPHWALCFIQSRDPVIHFRCPLSSSQYVVYRGQVSVCVCQIVCGATACYLSDSCLSPVSCPSCLPCFFTFPFRQMSLGLANCLHPECQVSGFASVHTLQDECPAVFVFTNLLALWNWNTLNMNIN